MKRKYKVLKSKLFEKGNSYLRAVRSYSNRSIHLALLKMAAKTNFEFPNSVKIAFLITDIIAQTMKSQSQKSWLKSQSTITHRWIIIHGHDNHVTGLWYDKGIYSGVLYISWNTIGWIVWFPECVNVTYYGNNTMSVNEKLLVVYAELSLWLV